MPAEAAVDAQRQLASYSAKDENGEWRRILFVPTVH